MWSVSFQLCAELSKKSTNPIISQVSTINIHENICQPRRAEQLLSPNNTIGGLYDVVKQD